MTSIGQLSDTPKYAIKAVCAQTGIRSATLRAWERRYNLLNPHRTDGNYRLYSDRDVAILRWLKSRVDAGQVISSAAAEFREMRSADLWPDQLPALIPPDSTHAPNPPSAYSQRLYNSLTGRDEAAANAVLSEAHAVFDLGTVCLDVITPCLVLVGEAWHRGELLISTEHYCTNFLRGRIMTLLQSFPVRHGAPRIILGCVEHERHDVGVLMFSTLLRREGFNVEFLGADVPSDDLIAYVRDEKPALLCLSAGTEETARELRAIHLALNAKRAAVRFGYGGRIFLAKPSLRESIPGTYLGDTVVDGVATVRRMLG